MENLERDEILRRAQEQKEDEWKTQVYLQSNRLAMIVGLAACLLLWFIKVLAGQPLGDVFGLYFCISSVSHFYNWYHLHGTSDLVWGCIGAIVAVFEMGRYIVQMFV